MRGRPRGSAGGVRAAVLRIALAAVAGGCAASGASASGTPRPVAVAPSSGPIDRDTEIVVRGDGFAAGDRVALLGGGPWRTAEWALSGSSESYAVALQDGIALVAFFESAPFKSGGFRVLDVSDRARPVEIGAYVLPDINGADVVRAGDRAILLSWNRYTFDGGLHEVDVTDPRAPRERAIHYFQRTPRKMTLAGGALLVTYVGDQGGVLVFDAADLSRPPQDYPVPGEPWTAALAAGRLAVTWSAGETGGVSVFALDDPRGGRRDIDTGGPAYGLAAAGDMLLAAVGDPVTARRALVAIDPVLGTIAGEASAGGIGTSVRVDGPRAYVALGGAGIEVFDVAAPASPRRIGGYAALGFTAWDFAVRDAVAYVADQPSGLDIVDLVRPAPPPPTGRATAASYAASIGADGDLAVLALWDGTLEPFDVTDPAAPRSRGTLAVPGAAVGVHVRGREIAVAALDAGLVTVDADSGEVTGSFETPGSALDVVVAEVGTAGAAPRTLAYVADDFRGLTIVDITDRAAPRLAGVRDTLGSAAGVAVRGSTVFVADGRRGLVTIDASDPARPRQLAEMRTCLGELIVFASAVAAGPGSDVYVAAGTQGVLIVDARDPARPQCVGRVPPEARAQDVAARADGTIAIADAEAGLLVVDVADPSRPVTVGRYAPGGAAGALALAGGHLYVAMGDAGLGVVRPNPRLAGVRVVDDRTIAAIVPAGFAAGSYHARVASAPGSAGDAPNAYAACAGNAAIEGHLAPVLDPRTQAIVLPLAWRLTTDRAGARAAALVPGPARDAAWHFVADAAGDTIVFEWTDGPRGGAVVARGPHEAAARAAWDDALSAGFPLGARPAATGSSAFGDVAIVARAARGTRCAWRVRAGVLESVHVEAPAPDVVFDVVAVDGLGCPARGEVRYFGELRALCDAAAPPNVVLPCAGDGVGDGGDDGGGRGGRRAPERVPAPVMPTESERQGRNPWFP